MPSLECASPRSTADADPAGPKLTPGDVFDVTIQDICTPGYSRKVRAVPVWLKKQAYARYGITSWKPGDYEVDHLFWLSLGG